MSLAKKHRARNFGRRGESIALIWLRLKGYQLLTRNFKAKGGEIDLIMVKGKTLVVVEVKSRNSVDFMPDVLHPRQQERLSNMARLFIAKNPEFDSFAVRFDVIIIRQWRLPEHIRQAWRASN